MSGPNFFQNHNGSGHNIINLGRQQFQMTDGVMQSIASQLGQTKELEITAIGSSRSAEAASKLANYLVSHGFTVTALNTVGMRVPPQSQPVELHGNELCIDADR